MQSLFLLLKLSLVVLLTLTLVNAHGGQGGRRQHVKHRPSRRSSRPWGSRSHPTLITRSNLPHSRFPQWSRTWTSHAHYPGIRPTHHFKTKGFMKSKEPPKHPAHKKGKHYLSHEAKSAIIVLALVLVCLCAGLGTWYYLKGKNPKKERDVVQEFENPIKFPQASVA